MVLKSSSSISTLKLNIVNVWLVFWSILGFSQNENNADTLISAFQEFGKLPREVAYVHLNKTTYIKGETLAFTAYVFDKGTKKPSNLTTNLYCTISDENGQTVKKNMFLVNQGIANGSFYVDSLFTSGNYTFKAFTNWMKNFEEQNFYTENIKVIDPEIENFLAPKVITSKLDAQFLPEGGHLLLNTRNTMGVVIKDSLGFGVPFVKAQLLNSKNEIVTAFETNQFGIGKFMFVPKDSETYHVEISFEGRVQSFKIDKAEPFGVVVSLIETNKRVLMRFTTNENTIDYIKNKPYQLMIHNGSDIKSVNLAFNDSLELTIILNYIDLFSGINIFTLFNEKNEPLLERLFFKHADISTLKLDETNFIKDKDSALVTMTIKDIDTRFTNNFSVSVLPEGTTSYNHHHNIISYLFLQPYVKGYIENAKYYFTDITRKKKYELDNLLLTQGWSSYDWSRVFNNNPKAIYPFESGVHFKATVNNFGTGKFVMFPTLLNGLETFELSEGNNSFEKKGLFPLDDETLSLGEIRKNKSVRKTEVYAQFFPSRVPDLEKYIKVLPLKENVFYGSNSTEPIINNSWTKVEQLDSVVITVDKEKERIEKLKNSTFLGHVDVLDQTTRNAYLTFGDYIRTKGFRVIEDMGVLTIYSNRGIPKVPVTVYLDDVLVFNLSQLYGYRMDFIDYVIYDKSGFGEGLRGSGGVIRIYTDTNIAFQNNPTNSKFQEIEIPLTFTKPSKFYAPKYNSYQSSFFKEYGVIDWFPDKSVDENGNISFKISNQSGSNIKLFIEGTANNGAFISEAKTVNLN